jgi:hypothetical protein
LSSLKGVKITRVLNNGTQCGGQTVTAVVKGAL